MDLARSIAHPFGLAFPLLGVGQFLHLIRLRASAGSLGAFRLSIVKLRLGGLCRGLLGGLSSLLHLASCGFGRLLAAGGELLGLPLGRGTLLLGSVHRFAFAVLSGFAGVLDLLLSRGACFLPFFDGIVAGCCELLVSLLAPRRRLCVKRCGVAQHV